MVLLCLFGSGHGLAQPRSPAWTASFPPGIEWAQLSTGAGTPAIVLADRDGRLHVLDAQTGAARLDPALRASPGVRCAGELQPSDGPSAGVVFCFHRHAAYAVQTAGNPRLRWQHGRAPAEPESFPGEPDTLTGWVAGQVTTSGLLLANSDGRLVLLNCADGRVLWEQRVAPRLSAVTLHARGQRAVALVSHAGRTRAIFLGLAGSPAIVAERELPSSPIWSSLTERGLVTVGNDVWLLDESGATTLIMRNVDGRAATLALWEPRELGPHAQHAPPAPPPVLILGRDRELAAVRIPDGRTIWTVTVGEPSSCARRSAAPDGSSADHTRAVVAADGSSADNARPGVAAALERVELSGTYVLACGQRSATAINASDGTRVARLSRTAPWRLLGATVRDCTLLAAFHDPTTATIHVERTAVAGPPCADSAPATSSTSAPAISAPSSAASAVPTADVIAQWDGPPAGVRDVLWPAGRVVVVESGAVRAIQLRQ